MEPIADTTASQPNHLPQYFAKTSFGKLPLEIRLQIYELAVLTEGDISQPNSWPQITLAKPSTATLREGENCSHHSESQARSCLQLLCVCRQMHGEAFDIVCSQFFSQRIVCLEDAAALHRFLTTLGATRVQFISALHFGPGLVDHVPTDNPDPMQEEQDKWHHSTAPNDPCSRATYVSLRSRQARFGNWAQESRDLLAGCTGLRTIYFDVYITDWTPFRKWLSPTVLGRPTHCIKFHAVWDWTLCSPRETEEAARSHAIWVPICEDLEEDDGEFPQGSRHDGIDVLQVELEVAPAEIFAEKTGLGLFEEGTKVE